jgi:hypothetical protein
VGLLGDSAQVFLSEVRLDLVNIVEAQLNVNFTGVEGM